MQEMEAKNVTELYCACRDGDAATVKRLLPRTSPTVLNRVESNGSTCYDAARYNGHQEILHLLLKHKQSHQTNGRTPLDLAQAKEIGECSTRPAEGARYRFAENLTQGPEWLFGHNKAEQYSRAVEWDCIKDRGVKKTVEKVAKARIIPDDEAKESKLLRFYFNEAREKNDPTYLLKAYTVESSFYKVLNQYMATGRSSQVFKKLCRKWSGYYIGAIVKNPALERYRFSGITYRGMEVFPADMEQYECGTVLANKALQSTSKSINIALQFACKDEPTPGKIAVILIYEIRNKRSALDITLLSEYQYEEEVLLVPGTLFKVDWIEKSRRPFEIHLRQMVWRNE